MLCVNVAWEQGVCCPLGPSARALVAFLFRPVRGTSGPGELLRPGCGVSCGQHGMHAVSMLGNTEGLVSWSTGTAKQKHIAGYPTEFWRYSCQSSGPWFCPVGRWCQVRETTSMQWVFPQEQPPCAQKAV